MLRLRYLEVSLVNAAIVVWIFAHAAPISMADQAYTAALHCAYSALQSKQYKIATDSLRETIRLNPHDTTARRYVGIALYHQGNVQAAIDNLTYCTHVDGGQAIDWLILGQAHFTNANFHLAIKQFNKVLTTHPRCIEAHTGLYNCYKALGDRHQCELIEQRAHQYGFDIGTQTSVKHPRPTKS